MDFTRMAENLWFEWTGEGFNKKGYKSVVYFTYDHVDLHNPICVGGLASCLQRDGVVDSLREGREAVEKSSSFYYGHAGAVDDAPDLTVCSELGETYHGDTVDKISDVTIVEVFGLGE